MGSIEWWRLGSTTDSRADTLGRTKRMRQRQVGCILAMLFGLALVPSTAAGAPSTAVDSASGLPALPTAPANGLTTAEIFGAITPATPAQLAAQNAQEAPILAAQQHLSVAQAMQDLQTQSEAPRIVSQVASALGAGYAGVWFDLPTGKFVVGVAPSTSQSTAMAAAVSSGVASDQVQSVPVENTWAQLEATKAALVNRDSAAIAQGAERIGIDPANNAVEVDVSGVAPAAVLSSLYAVASASTVAIEVQRKPAASLGVRPTTLCNFPFCDTPLRGGVEIYSCPTAPNQPCSICSSGFVAEDIYSTRWELLTAGHCVALNVGDGAWKTAGHAYIEHYFGTQNGRYVYGAGGDAAAIPITGSTYTVPGGFLPPEVVVWHSFNDYWMNGVAWSYPGEFLCHEGRTTGGLPTSPTNYTCGTDNGVMDATEYGIDHLTQNSACSLGGDSGGPWITYNVGYGIESLGTPTGYDCTAGFPSFYMEAGWTEINLSVYVPQLN